MNVIKLIMKFKTKLSLMAVLLFSITLMAQNPSFTVTGTVTSEVDDTPIPGASILVVNSSEGYND